MWSNRESHTAGKESAHNSRDSGSILGSGRSPVEGIGYPCQYSCLENHMDRGAWWATVHGVTKSWTWLNKHVQESEDPLYGPAWVCIQAGLSTLWTDVGLCVWPAFPLGAALAWKVELTQLLQPSCFPKPSHMPSFHLFQGSRWHLWGRHYYSQVSQPVNGNSARKSSLGSFFGPQLPWQIKSYF